MTGKAQDFYHLFKRGAYGRCGAAFRFEPPHLLPHLPRYSMSLGWSKSHLASYGKPSGLANFELGTHVLAPPKITGAHHTPCPPLLFPLSCPIPTYKGRERKRTIKRRNILSGNKAEGEGAWCVSVGDFWWGEDVPYSS